MCSHYEAPTGDQIELAFGVSKVKRATYNLCRCVYQAIIRSLVNVDENFREDF